MLYCEEHVFCIHADLVGVLASLFTGSMTIVHFLNFFVLQWIHL